MVKDLTLKAAEELLRIERSLLDEECRTQAEVFYRIASNYTIAVSRRDAEKDKLVGVDAEVADNYRREAELNNKKMTEGKLKELVQLDPRHKKAFISYSDCKLEADKWGILKDSFLQRATMLKELCGLYISGYFADVIVKGDDNTREVRYKVDRKRRQQKRDEKVSQE